MSITVDIGEERRIRVAGDAVEGSVLNVPEETLRILESGDVTFESLSFAADDAVRSDGGSADDVVFEVALLGYGITVRRDGTIAVGVRDDLTGFDPS